MNVKREGAMLISDYCEGHDFDGKAVADRQAFLVWVNENNPQRWGAFCELYGGVPEDDEMVTRALAIGP